MIKAYKHLLLHPINNLILILVLLFKRLLVSYMVSSPFAIVIASFTADNLFNITWNSLNPSLNPPLFKLVLCLLPCPLSFYSISWRSLPYSDSFKVSLAWLNYV